MESSPQGTYFFLDNGDALYRSPSNEVRKVHPAFGFETLEVGDQKTIPGANIRKVTNAAYTYGRSRRIPWKFSVWREGENIIVRRVK